MDAAAGQAASGLTQAAPPPGGRAIGPARLPCASGCERRLVTPDFIVRIGLDCRFDAGFDGVYDASERRKPKAATFGFQDDMEVGLPHHNHVIQILGVRPADFNPDARFHTCS